MNRRRLIACAAVVFLAAASANPPVYAAALRGDRAIPAAESMPQRQPLPPNDDVAHAELLGPLPYTVGGSTTGASDEPDEVPAECGYGDEDRGVWYLLEAASAGTIIASTQGTADEFDTVVSVWSGEAHPLEEIECNDDALGGSVFWSQVVFAVEPGNAYYIKVSNLEMGAPMDFVLNVRLAAPSEVNDDLAGAVQIDALPFEWEAPFNELTNEPGEAAPTCGEWAEGAWFEYTAATDGRVGFYGEADGESLSISVWTGSAHPLTEAGCSVITGESAPLSVLARAGEPLYVRVQPFATPVSLATVHAVAGLDPPANDTRATAEVIQLPFQAAIDTTWATSDEEEAASGCAPLPDGGVWYEWNAATDGRLAVHAAGSNFATSISILREEPGGSLTTLHCVTRGLVDGNALATADVRAGEKIYLLAGGAVGNRGLLRLGADLVTVPANDNLADALQLGPLPVEAEADTAYATAEPNEADSSCLPPGSRGFVRGVWYRLVPAAAGRLIISSPGAPPSVWTGGPAHPLTEVACAGLYTAPLVTNVEAGTVYYIRLATAAVAIPPVPAAFSMRMAGPPPPNDQRIDATVIASLPYYETVDLSGSTEDPGEVRGACEGFTSGTHVVWYRLTAAVGERVLFRVGSDWPLAISVFRDDGNTLEEVACAYESVAPTLEAGATYLIRVASPIGPAVIFDFGALVAAPPSNDNLASAIEVGTLPFTNTVTTEVASDEPDEADSQCNPLPENAVWYAFTAPYDVRIRADTIGSGVDFDTVLSAWSGAAQSFPLVPLACNDDAFGLQSRIDLYIRSGERVYFRAGGLGGSTGNLRFNLDVIGRPPPNDNLADARVIAPLNGFSDSVDTSAASRESEEEAPSCQGSSAGLSDRTAWYTLDGTAPMTVTLTTAGSRFDTVLSVWTGGPAHPLQELWCNDDNEGAPDSRLSFAVAAGERYFVQVTGLDGDGGELHLASAAELPAPSSRTVFLPWTVRSPRARR